MVKYLVLQHFQKDISYYSLEKRLIYSIPVTFAVKLEQTVIQHLKLTFLMLSYSSIANYNILNLASILDRY